MNTYPDFHFFFEPIPSEVENQQSLSSNPLALELKFLTGEILLQIRSLDFESFESFDYTPVPILNVTLPMGNL